MKVRDVGIKAMKVVIIFKYQLVFYLIGCCFGFAGYLSVEVLSEDLLKYF